MGIGYYSILGWLRWVGSNIFISYAYSLLCLSNILLMLSSAQKGITPLEIFFGARRPPVKIEALAQSEVVGGGPPPSPRSAKCTWIHGTGGGEVTCQRHEMSQVTPAKETQVFLVWLMLSLCIPSYAYVLKGDCSSIYIYIYTSSYLGITPT